MKKILITRRLLRSCEDKAGKIFDAKFNSNDELHSQEKLIKLSEGCDGILSALTMLQLLTNYQTVLKYYQTLQ